MNRNKSLHASNPRKGSIAIRTSFNQAPSLKNLLTVRTQNSDKNPKNDFSKTEYDEEFGINEDGHGEGFNNKLVGITAGKSTNENNNSLLMGSFENFDLGQHEVKETRLNPNVHDFNELGNNSSVKGGFFNIDIDHDITPTDTSKNKIFMEEFSVEPSEFELQNLARNKKIISKGGENSTKHRNNMNVSEFSRLSSNYQQYNTNNKNRNINNRTNGSFNGSSQRKPSHSNEGVETPIACEEAAEVKDKDAKFKINFEPFNENKSID